MSDSERRRLSSLGKENLSALQASSSKHSKGVGQNARTPLQSSSSRVNRDVLSESTLRVTSRATPPLSDSKSHNRTNRSFRLHAEEDEPEQNEHNVESKSSNKQKTSDADETVELNHNEEVHTNAKTPRHRRDRRRVRWYNNTNQSLRGTVHSGQHWDESMSEEGDDYADDDDYSEYAPSSGDEEISEGNTIFIAPEDLEMYSNNSDDDDEEYNGNSSSDESIAGTAYNSDFSPIPYTHGKFKPSERLGKHLGLEENGDKALDIGGEIYLLQAEQRKKRAKEYLHHQEEKLYNQLCLMAPDTSEENIYVQRAKKCFDAVRLLVLHKLSTDPRYTKCGYVMLFCEFACFSAMRDGQNGPCLYLMSDCKHLTSLTEDVQSLVKKEKYGGYLDVIVQMGTPKLFGIGDRVRRAIRRVSTGLLRGGRSTTTRESSEREVEENDSDSKIGEENGSEGEDDSKEDVEVQEDLVVDEEEVEEGENKEEEEEEEKEGNTSDNREEQTVQVAVDKITTNDPAENLYGIDRELAGIRGVKEKPRSFVIFDERSSPPREESGSPSSMLAEVESTSFDLHIPYDPDWNKENIPPPPSLSPPRWPPSPDMDVPGLRSALRPIKANIKGKTERKPTPTSASGHKTLLRERVANAGDDSVLRGASTVTSPHKITATEVIRGVIKTRQRTGYQLDQRGFHNGLRYITNLPIAAPEEGMQASYHRRPNIGESLGHAEEKNGCGTLAGYLIDANTGERFAMSAFHVVSGKKLLVEPLGDGPQVGTVVTAPATSDFGASVKSVSHIKAGLLGEFYRSAHFGDNDMALYIKEHEGNLAYDNVKKHFKEDGSTPVDIRFGQVVASCWTIRNRGKAKYLVDIGVMKPLPDRVGRNTFTYIGRDNEHGHRYRLEAAGWAKPTLGREVLKVGRTTGLTRGTVISTEADMRLSIGMSEGDTYYWEVNCSVATAGSGPWFSEAGDSGSFVLDAPKINEMRKHEKYHPLTPMPAPVVGMLFGGADSVEGVHLTFFNDSSLIKSELKRLTGRRLVPGSFLGQEQYDAKAHVLSGLKSGGLKTPIGSRKKDPMGIMAPGHPFRKTVSFEEIVKIFPPPHPKDKTLVRKEPVITKLDGRKKDIHEPKRESEFASVRTRTPSPCTPTPEKRKKPTPGRGNRKQRAPTARTVKKDETPTKVPKVKDVTIVKENKKGQKRYISGSPKRAPVHKIKDDDLTEFDGDDENTASKVKLKPHVGDTSPVTTAAAHSSNTRNQFSKNSRSSTPSPERSRGHSRIISPHSVDGIPTTKQIKSRSKVKTLTSS